LLLLGQILPLFLAAWLMIEPSLATAQAKTLVAVCVIATFLPRLIAVFRFRQRLLGALLHPFGVGVLLTLQWYAFVRKAIGQPAIWKQRAYDAG
jgi:hypothetical protein